MIPAATDVLLRAQVRKIEALRPEIAITAIATVGVTVFVTFPHPGTGRRYTLRFQCDGYPVMPASVHFVDDDRHEDIGPEVWPTDNEQAFKTRSNPRFICLPGTREYHSAHGAALPDVHSLTLATIFHQVVQRMVVAG